MVGPFQVGRYDVMHNDDDGSFFLRKERTNTTYDLLLRKAIKEGRVGGRFRCPVCGMRYSRQKEAATCCEKVGARA